MIDESFQTYWKATQKLGRLILPMLYDMAEPAFEADGYRNKGPVRSILLVRLDAIGDMVMTSSLIRELRRNYPQARFDVVASPLVKPMVELCPYIDEVFSFDKEHLYGAGNLLPGYKELWMFCRESLWPQHYDLSICPEWNGDVKIDLLLSYMSGAKRRIAYDQNVSQKVYKPHIFIPPEAEAFQRSLHIETYLSPPEIIHEALRSLYFLTVLGLQAESDSLEVWLCEKDRARARRKLFPYRNLTLVALGLGAGSAERKYPVEKYKEAIVRITEQYPTVRFIALGGAAEHEDGQYLERTLTKKRVIDCTQQTTLRETAAMVEETSLYMGNDTGLMHIAAALKRPVILICREARNWHPRYPGISSALARFSPWQTLSIRVQPMNPMGACATMESYGGCEAGKPHCITQITSETIAHAFDVMMKQINDSK